jgi:hypothetical protein
MTQARKMRFIVSRNVLLLMKEKMTSIVCFFWIAAGLQGMRRRDIQVPG